MRSVGDQLQEVNRDALAKATSAADRARHEADELRAELAKLKATETENAHLHAILNIKNDKELRQTAVKAKEEAAEARKERDVARGEFARLSSGSAEGDGADPGQPPDPRVIEKLLGRIAAREDENSGLSQYVDKLIQDLMKAKLAAGDG